MRKPISGHQARKRFGQNFLQDHDVIDRIIQAINPAKNERVVEIGPGLGALTDNLVGTCFLSVIELDRDLAPRLQEKYGRRDDFEIFQGDALKFDFDELIKKNKPGKTDKIRLAGNLPYNISTPIIFHLLKFKNNIRDMHFMLQKEVVERMTAEPGSKTYGRLSVILQYGCEVSHLFNVKPDSFNPPPKVDSAIVRIKPKGTPAEFATDEDLFQHLVAQAFSQRRKTIKNTLKTLATEEQLQAAGIDPGARPEAIDIQGFVRLANVVACQ